MLTPLVIGGSPEAGSHMTMSHKAYWFDWDAFRDQLASRLMSSLANRDAAPLIEFGNAHLASLSDPYEGNPLQSDWADALGAGDVQTAADYVLTKFYRPTEDFGVGDMWLAVEGALSVEQRAALLGKPFGPEPDLFDPGRMGSYFQDASECRTSLQVLRNDNRVELATFVAGLAGAVGSDIGVYITF